MATIRRIVAYKTFINKQIQHKYINNKDGTVCGRCLDREANNVHLTKMHSAYSIHGNKLVSDTIRFYIYIQYVTRENEYSCGYSKFYQTANTCS